MSSIRGRVIRAGGVATQPQGAASRTDGTGGAKTNTGQPAVLRPPFSFSGQIFKPTAPASLQDALSPHSVFFWRLVILGAAVAYVVGFHLKLPVVGRVRV